MHDNILESIINKRKEDIKACGHSFGLELAQKRERPIHSFLEEDGVILEVKRASPSKGDIAPDLNPYLTAKAYCKAGARAISCLTEKNYFKGCLKDLMEVCRAVDEEEKSARGRADGHVGGANPLVPGTNPHVMGGNASVPAVLRKDFLTDEEDIRISYLAGADAVLLIARILSPEELSKMLKALENYGLSCLIELRTEEDLEKCLLAVKDFDKTSHLFNKIRFGVNSRDLKDFSIDRLVPAGMLKKIREAFPLSKVVFESGILSENCAAFVKSMGFNAFLMGEAAAKNPSLAASFVEAFNKAEPDANGKAWLDFSSFIAERKSDKPLVKICGNTNEEDSLLAARLGADFLGFIFYSKSKRNIDGQSVTAIRKRLEKDFHKNPSFYKKKLPYFVGVIADLESKEAEEALKLCREGIIDFLQVHTAKTSLAFLQDKKLCCLPHYCAVNISSKEDLALLDQLEKEGESRILLDAKSEGKAGGSGKRIDEDILKLLKDRRHLWLAGGISKENVRDIEKNYFVELVDLVSSLEAEEGKKDIEKMKDFFKKL